MTPELLVTGAIATAVVLLVAYFVRRASRHTRGFELGAVSTRWLAELRRDEPWPHS